MASCLWGTYLVYLRDVPVSYVGPKSHGIVIMIVVCICALMCRASPSILRLRPRPFPLPPPRHPAIPISCCRNTRRPCFPSRLPPLPRLGLPPPLLPPPPLPLPTPQPGFQPHQWPPPHRLPSRPPCRPTFPSFQLHARPPPTLPSYSPAEGLPSCLSLRAPTGPSFLPLRPREQLLLWWCGASSVSLQCLRAPVALPVAAQLARRLRWLHRCSSWDLQRCPYPRHRCRHSRRHRLSHQRVKGRQRPSAQRRPARWPSARGEHRLPATGESTRRSLVQVSHEGWRVRWRWSEGERCLRQRCNGQCVRIK